MKKITAILISVIMSAAVFSGCGNKISDSSAGSASDTSSDASADVSSETGETSSEEETSIKELETNGDYTKAYSEKIKGGVYAMDGVITMPMFGETPMAVKVNGSDLYANITTLGVYVEVYQVDGKTYNLMPQVQSYMVTEAKTLQELGVSTYDLPSGSSYLRSYEENGLIVEEFEIPTVVVADDVSEDVQIDLGDNTSYVAKYYFDNSGLLKKVVSETPMLGETVFEINSLTFDDVVIELPDLSEWTEMKEGEQLDKAASLKMGLAIYGITEEMITDAGYTYEQLAEMEEEEVTEILTKIAEDNGLSFDLQL
ncbi:MAG: hypothetical protein IJ555_05230 [Ruminococcus sp.]|nr:hypothetical protein [Ruminococcus sp.]